MPGDGEEAMNFEEGARRIFVVLQWSAAAIVIAFGLLQWPQRGPQPNPFDQFDTQEQTQAAAIANMSDEELIAAYNRAREKNYVTDPALLAQLNRKGGDVKPWELPWANDPIIETPEDRSRAHAIDLSRHVALFGFGAAFAYLSVYAIWRLLRWVFTGFSSPYRRGERQ